MLYLIPKYLISTGKTVEEEPVNCVNMSENHGASQMSPSIQRVDFNQRCWHNVRDADEKLKGRDADATSEAQSRASFP